MADSIRELIVKNVVSTLEGITETAGYAFNIKQVVRFQQSGFNLASAEYPFIAVVEDAEDVEEGSPANFTTKILHLTLFCWAFEYHSIGEAVNMILAAVEKILYVDYNRGAKAIDTDIISNATVLSSPAIPYGGVEIKVDILYRHRVGDPFTQ